MEKADYVPLGRKKQWEVADIFRLYGDSYRQSNALSYEKTKVMHHIAVCRTAELGGHLHQCDQCGFEQIAYNSCRDRHCPKCQCLVKEQWLNDRKAELLPCGYFHLVFTLPHGLNPIILSNKRICLQILFSAVSETLQAFAKDPKWRLEAQLGFISVLHTWSQTLMDHFHLHCLIPAGALSFTKHRWIPARKSFLFKIDSVAKAFKKRYLQPIKIKSSASKPIQRILPPKKAFKNCYAPFLRLTGLPMQSHLLPVHNSCLNISVDIPTG